VTPPAGAPQPSAFAMPSSLCEDRAWQASSLRLLQERPFASLFSDSFNMTSFDPTGLEQIDSTYYVVFNGCGLLHHGFFTLAMWYMLKEFLHVQQSAHDHHSCNIVSGKEAA
jgi:hypothetical protein